MSGVKGYIRATCNPDADSWVARFIDWWIDPVTGLPIQERSGVLRWLLRVNDTLHWADKADELISRFDGQLPKETILPKSVTFIPSRLSDNVALMKADPAYLGNLMALPTVERERLLAGNWKIRPAAGLYFQRRWLKGVKSAPPDTKWCRGWDIAGTPKTETNDPDFTASTLIGRSGNTFYIGDHFKMRGSPAEVDAAILRTAKQDKAIGLDVVQSLPQDPGQAGKAQAAAYAKLLMGYRFRCTTESRTVGRDREATPMMKAAKVGRFGPFSSQCEAGNVLYIEGAWNTELFDDLEAFPEALHDDSADSCSRAFAQFLDRLPGQNMLELAERHVSEEAEKAKADKPAPIKRTYAPGSVEYAMMLLGKKPDDDEEQ